MNRISAIGAAALVLVPVCAASGAIIHVPDDVPSISWAVATAASGDEIIVAPGTYSEWGILCQNKNVIVRGSVASADSVVIDAHQAMNRGHDLLSPQIVKRLDDGIAVDLVVVAQQEAWRGVEHERLPQLQRGPLRGRMLGDVDVHDAPPVQRQHDQHVQRAERHRRHGEKVDGRRLVQVVPQERLPVLRRSAASLEHVAGDGGLVQEVTELEQLAVNARRAPRRVLARDPADQLDHFPWDARPARLQRLALATPPPSPRLAVPSDHGLGLHQPQRRAPAVPPLAEQDPERAVAIAERRLGVGALQDKDLLAQGQVLQEQVAAGAQEVAQEGDQEVEHG